MKFLKSSALVQIKGQAKVINSSIKEKNAILAQIEKAKAKLQKVNEQIAQVDAFIYGMHGVHIEEVVKREVISTPTKDGKILKKSVYVPTSNVSWDEEKKLYVVLKAADCVAPEGVPSACAEVFDEEVAGTSVATL